MKRAGFVKKRRRRWRKRKDLLDLKKTYAFFEKSQIDTKDLSDILNYWPLKSPAKAVTARNTSVQ
ncbi:MAG: hypothetical protein AUJ71_01080 [Candidatus Omnitrophica bacterium CG1_02_49_16]|nr:MAG: hypothetical protein AUJ71_01080 [Candidatus Omnitrophica bacterium CG1_02_49_16]